MKTTSTFIKILFTAILCSFFVLNALAQIGVKGEILADTNNVTVVKVWGTHYERGYAHGYFLGDKILDIVEGYLIPSLGSFYPTARALVTDGENLVFDSVYQTEAKAMIKGMGNRGEDGLRGFRHYRYRLR